MACLDIKPVKSESVMAPFTDMDAMPRMPTPTESDGVRPSVMVNPEFT